MTQERTTTPDKYSDVIKQLRIAREAKHISWFAFTAAISVIWEKRHGRA